jgi:uncharacterized protein
VSSTFLTAEWCKLIMAQYVVEPAMLAPWLPEGLELDLYEGRCCVSLVGFLFDNTRLKGLRIPFHTRFEEINLRFYVRRVEADGTQTRGVVFVREFVPRAAISIIANTLYEEPYTTLPTRCSIVRGCEALSVRYDWRHRGVWQSLAVEASPVAQPIDGGSEEESLRSTIGDIRSGAMDGHRRMRCGIRGGRFIRCGVMRLWPTLGRFMGLRLPG